MRTTAIVAAICTMGAVAAISTMQWHKMHQESIVEAQKNRESTAQSLEKTRELLAKGQPSKALKVIRSHKDEISDQTAIGKKWLSLFLQASLDLRHYHQLITLYEHFPSIFAADEQASIVVANGYLLEGNTQGYLRVRQQWQDREGMAAEWFSLDVDHLLLNDSKEEAIAYLNNHSLPGPQDAGRLVKLAFLHAPHDHKAAWEYLTNALSKDPENPEIYAYRGRLLESINKPSLALAEYITAQKVSSNDPLWSDQLAEFYVRQREYGKAIDTWKSSLSRSHTTVPWIKILFWSQVVAPNNIPWEALTIPQDKGTPFALYLANLKKQQFWDAKAFELLPNQHELLANQQSALWLKLIDDLQKGEENHALTLLESNTQKNSWAPSLAAALHYTLAFRKAHVSQSPSSKSTATPTKSWPEGPAFLSRLAALDNKTIAKSDPLLPDNVQELLLSKEAFAALFLAAGWNEAALQLHVEEIISESFPSWVEIALINAVKANHGLAAAISFAALQPLSENLSATMEALLAITKNDDNALIQLRSLSAAPSNVGNTAAWLSALIYLEQHNFSAAKAVIYAQPRLADKMPGKEMLARIATLEGDLTLAGMLYQAIEKQSTEAKSFLARKAFAEKDWEKARQLTEELIAIYPDSTLLRDNLQKIAAGQEKQL